MEHGKGINMEFHGLAIRVGRMGPYKESVTAIWRSMGFRWSLILCMGLAFLLPRDIDYIRSGLDSSWIYVINIAGELGWKFGEEIKFTRGPLGFLSSTCGVGHNIGITLWVTGILVLSQLWMLGRFLFARSAGQIGAGRMILSGLLLWAIPRPPFEGYLQYIILLSLSVAWFSESRRGYYLWACVLTTVQLFVMFASALSCCSAIGMFWILLFFKDRGAWRKVCWIPLSIPIAFVAGYLLYNPSWEGLWGYLRAAQEIASTYSSAMSLAEEPLYAWLVLALGGIYLVLLAWMAIGNRPAAQYVLLFCGCFWVAMKHGLVRTDIWHLDAALCAMMPMFSLILLFGAPKCDLVRKHGKLLVLVGGVVLVLLGSMLDMRGVAQKGKAYFRAVYVPNWSRISSVLGVADKMTNPLLGNDPLPRPFLESIGTNTVAFYPLELSFAAYNDVHFTVMPVLQAYTAHAPYLDACNADFFRDDSTGPAFVVLSLRALDGRWPLIESPLSWTAIYENYDVQIYGEPHLLLKRREVARRIDYRILSMGARGIGQEIALPAADGLVFMSVNMELTPWGRIVQWCYRIPPVLLRVALADGTVVEGRCIPANLASPTLVSFLPLPAHVQQTADFLRAKQGANNVTRIVFVGPGLKYYRQPMSITLLAGRVVAAGEP